MMSKESMTAVWLEARRGQSVGTVEREEGRIGESREERGPEYRESCVHEQVRQGCDNSGDVTQACPHLQNH